MSFLFQCEIESEWWEVDEDDGDEDGSVED